MENLKTMGSKGLTFMGWAVIIFGLGLLGMQVAQGLFAGKTAQTEYAEKAYHVAVYNLCTSEQALANAKLSDYFDGFIKLSDEDILRLKTKRESDCSF